MGKTQVESGMYQSRFELLTSAIFPKFGIHPSPSGKPYPEELAGGGIYYTHVVQMSEQQVYRRQTNSNVQVVILTFNSKMPMEYTPFQGVDQTRHDSHMLFGGAGVPVWGLLSATV
jgi:hypothetical protein